MANIQTQRTHSISKKDFVTVVLLSYSFILSVAIRLDGFSCWVFGYVGFLRMFVGLCACLFFCVRCLVGHHPVG